MPVPGRDSTFTTEDAVRMPTPRERIKQAEGEIRKAVLTALESLRKDIDMMPSSVDIEVIDGGTYYGSNGDKFIGEVRLRF